MAEPVVCTECGAQAIPVVAGSDELILACDCETAVKAARGRVLRESRFDAP